jgi:hypothetical protein
MSPILKATLSESGKTCLSHNSPLIANRSALELIGLGFRFDVDEPVNL